MSIFSLLTIELLHTHIFPGKERDWHRKKTELHWIKRMVNIKATYYIQFETKRRADEISYYLKGKARTFELPYHPVTNHTLCTEQKEKTKKNIDWFRKQKRKCFFFSSHKMRIRKCAHAQSPKMIQGKQSKDRSSLVRNEIRCPIIHTAQTKINIIIINVVHACQVRIIWNGMKCLFAVQHSLCLPPSFRSNFVYAL